MEYSTDQEGTIIERRLEVLPENDLPSMRVRVLTKNFEELPFINQPPFDALFDNGSPNFELAETAARLLHGNRSSGIIRMRFEYSFAPTRCLYSESGVRRIQGGGEIGCRMSV